MHAPRQVEVIRDQFLFRDFAMLKIFLTGAACSVALLAALAAAPSTRAYTEEASKGYRTQSLGVPSTMLGAFILGAGMAITGSCPGTVYVQFGVGMVKALYTFAGMVLGAFAYGAISPSLESFVRYGPTPENKHTVYEMLGLSRNLVAAATTLLFAVAVFLCEYLDPTKEVGTFTHKGETRYRWNPIIGGVLIGVLQFPLTVVLRKNAGASSTYVTLVGSALYPVLRNTKYFSSKMFGMANWWQVLYAASASIGSLAVLLLAGASVYAPSDAVLTWWEALIGGFLAVFGARMASGCTSGHGISGTGHLSIRSFLAVGAMFAGGIVVSFIFYA